MTARQQFQNKKPVNAFYKQLQQPFLEALIENNWPYWRLSEQMRVERGLFCPANHVIYSDHISYHPSVGCQRKARTSRMGVQHSPDVLWCNYSRGERPRTSDPDPRQERIHIS